MERSHIADERDDWGVPRIRTYLPERAQMGTDNDHVYPPIVPVEGVCIFCSVTSYSTSSRGSISEHHVSACMTCNNCSSKFCITCINELVDSIEGFDSIPRTVKRCDATYRKIMGMDTVHVNPAIVPVKGDSTERQRPTTMQSSQIDDERDDCGVPRSRTYSPERARIGTDTVRLYPAIVPVKGDSTKRPRPCNVCRSTMRGTITR